jgi:hypothetical protein
MITTKKQLIKELNSVKNVDELANVSDNLSDKIKAEFNNTLDNLEYSLENNRLYFLHMLNYYSYKDSDYREFRQDIYELKCLISRFKSRYNFVLADTDATYPKDKLNYDVSSESNRQEDNFVTMLDNIIEELE